MRVIALAALAACCISGVSSAAQEPPRTEHSYRTVPVAIVVSRPCVSVRGIQARILLPMNKLVELSHAPGPKYQTEQQRRAFFTGRRAALLLAQVSRDEDASGCAMVDLEHARDAVYLVGQLIKEGEATVIRDGSAKTETSVRVHEFNGSTSGSESFEFADGTVFLDYPTWIA